MTPSEGSSGQPPLRLPIASLLLLVPPALLLVAAGFVLSAYGYPVSTGFEAVQVNGSTEAGARLKAVATWFLLAMLGIASIGYLCCQLVRFDRRSRLALVLAFAVVGGAGLYSACYGKLEVHRFMGETLVCRAFQQLDRPEAVSTVSTATSVGKGESQARPPVITLVPETTTRDEDTRPCPQANWQTMSDLNFWQRLLLPLFTAALALGMIATLAQAPNYGFRQKAQRLNAHLYLASALLVCGLLFLSALIKWPGVLLGNGARTVYDAHGSALVLYWGIVYSLFIAALYLPIAWFLKRERAAAPMESGEDDGNSKAEQDLLMTPSSLVKIALAIFSPAITGLLAGIVSL